MDVLLSTGDEVLFVSIDSSISVVVIKGESSISDVSFFSCAKVIPTEVIDAIPIVRGQYSNNKINLFHLFLF
jgi:hypothetical protein